MLKDGADANDWYCAQIAKVLPTHVIVHYYTTELGHSSCLFKDMVPPW